MPAWRVLEASPSPADHPGHEGRLGNLVTVLGFDNGVSFWQQECLLGAELQVHSDAAVVLDLELF